MPPIRNFPMTAKPVKTERSHEENQERAYIAASRRSDRSLEARVESARRASEIHKRRTGRSLRVTEQDVVNEEMYEEEDDDLPNQYRRLTQHLNTNNSDFNRRLATYLTNHVAMRQALDAAMSTQNGQAWSPHSQQMPNTFQNPGIMGHGFPHNSTMMPSMMHRQGPSVAQSPYPLSPGQGVESGAQRPRPTSIATSHPAHGLSSPSSALNSPMAHFNFGGQQAATNASSPVNGNARSPTSPGESRSAPKASSEPTANNRPVTSRSLADTSKNPPQHDFGGHSGVYDMQHSPFQGGPHMISPTSPLTTQLPQEAQMFFNHGMNTPAGAFDQQPFYNYNPNFNSKKTSHPQTSGGMSETLAPPAFETKVGATAWPTPPSSEDQAPPFTATDGINFTDDGFFNTDFGQQPLDGMFGDGQPSPMDDFSSYIHDNVWDDTSAAA